MTTDFHSPSPASGADDYYLQVLAIKAMEFRPCDRLPTTETLALPPVAAPYTNITTDAPAN